MSKRKEITSYFQPKKKQTTTCEDEEPSAASIEVTGDEVEPLICCGINRNSEQNPQNPEIVDEGIDSENTDEIIDFNSLIRDPAEMYANTTELDEDSSLEIVQPDHDIEIVILVTETSNSMHMSPGGNPHFSKEVHCY
ncbi:hypothetical protein AgCh_034218 [Apium graveolens]